MGTFFIILSMFACHLCSKSFAKKAGLTEHCKGKKHLENISAPEKRKEIEALESAALAQRHKLSSDATSKFEAMRAAQDEKESADGTVTQVTQAAFLGEYQ